jgi:uncharacterized protein (TIGR03437 family)
MNTRQTKLLLLCLLAQAFACAQYTITTVAGNGSSMHSGDNGQATNAGLIPQGVAVDKSGNVYITDASAATVRKVDTSGTITVIACDGQTTFGSSPIPAHQALCGDLSGVAVDNSGNVYIAQVGGRTVDWLNPAGLIVVRSSAFNGPKNLAVDSAGNVYVADTGNCRIAKIDPSGNVTTVVGSIGACGFSGDNSPATHAQLLFPAGVAVDGAGNIYIADTNNARVRRVDSSGIITTVAGNGSSCSASDTSVDSVPAVNSGVCPVGVAVDGVGNLYIADFTSGRIRKVDNAGIITTIAGGGTNGLGDFGPATNAQLEFPRQVVVGPAGKIYIADSGNFRVRLLTPAVVGPSPSITNTAPNGAAAGGPALTLTINGSGFVAGSSVQWNGSALLTTFVSATQLTASVPASLIAVPGSASITVVNPGGIASNATTFTITPPVACTPTGLLIQVVNPQSGFAAPANQPFNIEVELADNCGIVASGAVSATFSNGDPAVNLTGIGQGNFAGTWAPRNLAPGGLVMQITAFEAISPGRILSAQVAISGSILSGQPQHLVTSVASLNFSLTQGGNPASQPLSILNQGSGTAAFTVGATGGAWLTVDLLSGSVSTSAPATVTVTVNPQSLAPGTYSGAISVTSGTQVLPPVTVAVTVSPAQPILLLSQTALSFTAAEGGGAPLPQDFGVLNIGQGPLNWMAAASSTGTWLSLSATSGTVSRPYLDVSSVNASVNPANLTAGTYYGQIQVTSPGFDNLLQTISVVLAVLPRGTSPGPEVRPSGLIFAGPQGPSPGAQTVMISNPSAKPALFNSAAITLPGIGTWFTSSPASTTIAPGQPAQMSIQPDFSRLAPGASRGAITLLFDDGTTRTIALLAVIPPSSVSGSSLRRDAGGCAPTQLNILPSLPSASQQTLTVSVGQPVTLDVRVVDSCGQPVTGSAAVQTTFSTGDRPISMSHIGNGRWTATWQPQKSLPANTPAAASVTAFLAAANGKVLANQIQIPVTFGPASGVPIVTSGGVLNAASFAASSTVAPGSLISIFGASLASGSTGQAAPVPLPIQLSGTQVRLAGRVLPLLYASNGQINAQAPFDLPVNVPSQLVVQAGDALSVPEPVLLAPAQPAVFTTDQSGQGQGVIVNGLTNRIADSSAPVTAGDTVVIYCTGLGAVNPPVALGAAATGPTPIVQPVSATIGGQTASVSYAGLTPGFPGLYQVNAVVPAGIAPSGQVPVVLSTAGQTSPVVTMAVR